MSIRKKIGGGGIVKRESNIELLRIITMLLIIAHHLVVSSGLTSVDGPIWAHGFNLHSISTVLFGMWGKTGINCFVLITGYYTSKSGISIRKYFILLAEVMFYNFAISVLFWATGYEKFSVDGLLHAIIPIRELNVNFTECFLMYYLLIPFLNILLDSLNRRKHGLLCILLLMIYTIYGTFRPVLSITFNYISWFSIVHIVAAYIRRYVENVEKWHDIKRWGIASVIFVIVDILSVMVCYGIGQKTGNNMLYGFVSDSNSFLALATGVSVFMMFKNLKVKKNKVINFLASGTFGVLLIHANNSTMRRWLWKDTLSIVEKYDEPLFMLYAAVSVMGIFLICTLMDWTRKLLFEDFYIQPFVKLEKRIMDKEYLDDRKSEGR